MRPTHTALTLSAFALALSLPAFAAEDHDHGHGGGHGGGHGHSDIQAILSSGQLTVTNADLTDAFTGYSLFEGEFGGLEGPNVTDDPGFDVEADVLPAGSFLALQAIGELLFWNGSSWGAAAAGTTLSFEDVIGEIGGWTAGGNFGGPGVIGLALTGEGVHSHVDSITISDGAALGAYLVSFTLINVAASSGDPLVPDFSNPLNSPSSPISIAFNFGLATEDFEAGIDARVAPVPVPAAVWLLGTSLAGLASCARQRRGNPA